MTIQTSGTIAISDIVSEFGGSAPHALTEYYRGGANVPDQSVNSSVPTSGEISLTDFYGAQDLVLAQLSYNGSASAVETIGNSGGTHRVTVAGNRVVKSFRIQSLLEASGGNMGIELTGQNIKGGGGTNISRTGVITETGLVGLATFANPNYGAVATLSTLTAPNNKFVIGVVWNNPYSRSIGEHGRHTNNMSAGIRYTSYENGTWSGGTSNTGVIFSEPGSPHSKSGQSPSSTGYMSGANLGTTQICIGIRIGNGGYGEWTDGGYVSMFQMGLRHTTSGIG